MKQKILILFRTIKVIKHQIEKRLSIILQKPDPRQVSYKNCIDNCSFKKSQIKRLWTVSDTKSLGRSEAKK